jgi:2-polyprenyl-3-methyl-5-hydroxy-6-metoxy-1,4-benzoquinol methylase
MTYDWRAELYKQYVSSGQGGAGAETAFAQQLPMYDSLIRRFVPADRRTEILDLACGAGGLLSALKRSGYGSVSGVDVSAEMITLANAAGVTEASQDDMNLRLKNSADASVDVIFAMDILEHLPRPELFKTSREMFRVLRPAGRLIAHVPNAAGIFGSVVRYGDLTHELSFTQSSMRQLMKVVGFEEILCVEDRPHAHGLRSLLRALIWPVVTLPFRLLDAVETGRLRGAILSRNMTVVCRKPG